MPQSIAAFIDCCLCCQRALFSALSDRREPIESVRHHRVTDYRGSLPLKRTGRTPSNSQRIGVIA
jgi:hypothetical protein